MSVIAFLCNIFKKKYNVLTHHHRAKLGIHIEIYDYTVIHVEST